MNIESIQAALITIPEAAKLLRLTRQRVLFMAKAENGTFPKPLGILFGHTVFDRAAVLAWIEQHRVKA